MMMSERHAAPHQINYSVSQSYIYQTPSSHDSPASRAQSSIEDLVPQTKVDEKSCVTFLLGDPGWYVQNLMSRMNGKKTHTHTHTHRYHRYSSCFHKKCNTYDVCSVEYKHVLRVTS